MARARAYILGTIPADVNFRGQALLVKNQLSTDQAQAKTVKEIADAITANTLPVEQRLQTRQDPIRVVSFYMSVWNKKKWVVPVTVDRPDAEAAATEAAETTEFHEGEGDATPEQERIEAATEADVTIAHEENPPTLNLEGLKVGEAVLAVLGQSANPATPETIAAFLNGRGYEVKTKQVQSALSNLVGKRAVRRDDTGAYARA